MKMKSEAVSKILTILLWVLLTSAAVELAEMIALGAAPDFFADHLYSTYSFVTVLAAVLYYVIIVIYLIWIYRIHMDLKQRYPFYRRSPGKALACLMVPIYNLFGTPAIYLSIGQQFQSSPRLHRKGRWISGLALPLLFGMFIDNFLVQRANRSDDPSAALLIGSSFATLLLYGVFLILCISVSGGLKTAFENTEPVDVQGIDEDAGPTVAEAPTLNA